MEIYFVRHGESFSNVNDLYNGIEDIELTERGINEAISLSKILNNINFSVVFSSPLYRARKTAEYCGYFNLKVSELLIERNYGLLEGMKIGENYSEELINSVESSEDLYLRLFLFLNELNDRFNADSKILIFTHGTCIKYILSTIERKPIQKIKIDNGSLTSIIMEKDLSMSLGKYYNYKPKRM
ncbi:phosphoglycerate mutase [Amedibacterium intestinale]|uniref:Phosphoglycerate mutase n=1 Tax=Amedibacterium intestinale TaxID=2583452 RepID=A0A6N4TJD8_9FIRM|nr:histidine phosphatase family protein [Amedibacterium intestinale]BBK22837.1 phosphoglycerate mutase [Amedibacterium intestinale]